MLLKIACIWLLTVIFPMSVFAKGDNQKIHIVIEESESLTKNEDNYYLGVLDFLLAYNKSQLGDYEIVVCRNYLTQERQLSYLRSPKSNQSDRCKIDLLWSSPAKGRNKGLLAINIPVDLGLNCIRTIVVLKKNEATFKNIHDLQGLSKFRACQGAQWPDTRILKSSRLNMVGSVSLDAMYMMLKRGRCDYLPTAINEINEEIDNYGKGELAIAKNLILRYRLPTYFYTRIDNNQLAKRLIDAFSETVKDGSFYTFVKEHKVTRRAFHIEFDNNLSIFDLKNEELEDPQFTPLLGIEDVSQQLFNFEPLSAR